MYEKFTLYVARKEHILVIGTEGTRQHWWFMAGQESSLRKNDWKEVIRNKSPDESYRVQTVARASPSATYTVHCARVFARNCSTAMPGSGHRTTRPSVQMEVGRFEHAPTYVLNVTARWIALGNCPLAILCRRMIIHCVSGILVAAIWHTKSNGNLCKEID